MSAVRNKSAWLVDAIMLYGTRLKEGNAFLTTHSTQLIYGYMKWMKKYFF